MPCFCPPTMQSLSSLMPTASLSVQVVPPQMPHLIDLLGLSGGSGTSRLDMQISSQLPKLSAQAYFQGIFAGPMMPSSGPLLMSLTARLGGVAGSFPLTNMSALTADLRLSLRSLSGFLFPLMSQMQSIPRIHIGNMVMAARLTLSMRSLGLCPLALAGLGMSFSDSLNLGDPQTRYNEATRFSASIRASMSRFAIPMPQMGLAMSLSALAPLATVPSTLGLPPVSSASFNAAAMGMLSELGSIPLPSPLPNLMADLSKLSDMMAINKAFGMDAMTPAGITRVQNMLSFMARLNLPALPLDLSGLKSKLDMLPSLDDVNTGNEVVQSSTASFRAALSFKPSMPQILPVLEAINAHKTVLADFLGTSPTGPCGSCQFQS